MHISALVSRCFSLDVHSIHSTLYVNASMYFRTFEWIKTSEAMELPFIPQAVTIFLECSVRYWKNPLPFISPFLNEIRPACFDLILDMS